MHWRAGKCREGEIFPYRHNAKPERRNPTAAVAEVVASEATSQAQARLAFYMPINRSGCSSDVSCLQSAAAGGRTLSVNFDPSENKVAAKHRANPTYVRWNLRNKAFIPSKAAEVFQILNQVEVNAFKNP